MMKIWSKFTHFLGQKMGQKIEEKNIKFEEIFHRQGYRQLRQCRQKEHKNRS